MVTAEQICQQANRLPQNVLPTVLDFMLFLQKRMTENQENDLVMAQESSMTALWDNEEDEAWNDVLLSQKTRQNFTFFRGQAAIASSCVKRKSP
jgi:hypothetical protein